MTRIAKDVFAVVAALNYIGNELDTANMIAALEHADGEQYESLQRTIMERLGEA